MKANHQQNQEQSASITGIRDSKPNGGWWWTAQSMATKGYERRYFQANNFSGNFTSCNLSWQRNRGMFTMKITYTIRGHKKFHCQFRVPERAVHCARSPTCGPSWPIYMSLSRSRSVWRVRKLTDKCVKKRRFIILREMWVGNGIALGYLYAFVLQGMTAISRCWVFLRYRIDTR